MDTTNGIAEAERTGREEGAGRAAEQVRLKWERDGFVHERFIYRFSSGGFCSVTKDPRVGDHGFDAAIFGISRARKTLPTQEEAQLWCESVLTGLLLRDLGSVLGENWTEAPGKTRLRVVIDAEIDEVTGVYDDNRAIHSFVIDRNTQQIRRIHTNECAINEVKPCNCVLNSTASVGVEVTRE